MGAMAGWRESGEASNRVLGTAGDDASDGRGLALAALERLTPRELEQAAFELLRDPAAEEEVRLPSRPESAGIARRLVAAVLRSWELAQAQESGELLAGELVANAVRHAGGRTVGLRMGRRQGWVRIEVRDSSRALPCMIVAAERGGAENGHGLVLVDAVSDRWGADLLPRGKSVWCELRVRERAA
ncbi:anti-sigma regulatory factor (Ser/Thr protein kinase) [Streptomyces sp. TLI_235]|nr:anti-sigma regulatory factor (Ser/Thr protein kinase) [Streptomyces sp. TLI_235]